MIKVFNLTWVVVRLDGEPLGFTLSGLRKYSQQALADCLGENWRSLYKQGFRCIKVDTYVKRVR